MRKIVFSFFFIFLAAGIFAQAETKENPAKKATQESVELFKLDSQQAAKMQAIQERKFTNLAEIEKLKATDGELYLKKLNALQYGIDMSTKRMLNENQGAIYQQRQLERRQKKAELYKQLINTGASSQEVNIQLVEAELKNF